jgi:hypothetical protein
MHVYFITDDEESWVDSVEVKVIGKPLALQADGSRLLLLPQLRRIQRAVRAFIQHRRWLRQARQVFTQCMKNSRLTPDLIKHICREYVK